MIIKRKQKRTEDNKTKAMAKAREKQRKRMISTKYGQTRLRHSRQGLKSCIYCVLTVFMLVLMISASYTAQGKVSILIGFAGLFALVLSCLGLITGIRGFKEREKNYITCKIGSVCSGLLVIGMCAIFIRGLF